jgi:hypothetical protein
MVSELNATFDEFAEFLVYQILFSEKEDDDEEDVDIDKLKEEVRERGQLLDSKFTFCITSVSLSLDTHCGS